MFHLLVNHNDDIRRLVEKGYAVDFDSNYLIVRDVPYLDDHQQLCWGALVAKLEFVDQHCVQQVDHQILFAGKVPHGLNDTPIPNLGGGSHRLPPLTDAAKDVVVERSFSHKPLPAGKYADFFEKIETYVAIISGPAMESHGANPYSFRPPQETVENSVFKFRDTLTSRAEIGDLASKFSSDIVALIGVGGTGAYILDFLVKTPVKEIRVFDLDYFHVHNAFRSPGGLDEAELGQLKTNVYQARYESFRHGLSVNPQRVDSSSAEAFDDVTFAFVCVDGGSARKAIFELLIGQGIPFIDAAMGLDRKQGPITGTVGTTYYSPEHAPQVRDKGFAQLADFPDDVYKTNIQISELNALNASLAVIRYKQLRGFYLEEFPYYHLSLPIGDLKVYGEWEL